MGSSSKQNEPVVDVQYNAIGTVSGGSTKYRVYLVHVAAVDSGEWRQELNAGTRQAQRRPRRLRDRPSTQQLPTATKIYSTPQ